MTTPSVDLTHALWAYAVPAALITMLPGPDTAMVLMTAVRSGRRAASRRWLPSFGWGFRRALMTCVLNPKVGVFFVVVLPQFIPAGAAVGPTSLALAMLHAAVAVLWYLLLGGVVAGGAGAVLARRQVRVWLDRVTAAVFLGFGLRLAADTAAR